MTEAGYMRNARCMKHYRQNVNRMTREYEVINSKAPTIIHKASNDENEYYQNLLNKTKPIYFNPLIK